MIAIIGAGISGLSLAWHLEQHNIPYQVFEAQCEVGGYLRSIREGEYLFEQGANSLLMDNEVESFIQQTGFDKELIYAKEVSKSRFIVRKGKPMELPSSPIKLLTSSFFSWTTKLNIFSEYFSKPTKINTHTTIGDFLETHFGKEVVDYAVSPFVTGIYAANPYHLLLEKTFPSLKEYAEKYGSILKGFMKNKSSENIDRKQSVSFKDGLQSFAKHLASQTNVRLQSHIQQISRQENKWQLHLENEIVEVDSIIITTSALPTSRLLKPHFTKLAKAIQELDYPPMCLIHSVFKKKDVDVKVNGFGALHPKVENTFSAGAIWSSSVFDFRAPDDEILFTGFVGGEQWKEYAFLEEKEILIRHTNELKNIYKINGEPILQKFKRWEMAVPQYNYKLLELDKEIEVLENTSIHILANWYQGVSLSDCIKKAKTLADSLVKNI